MTFPSSLVNAAVSALGRFDWRDALRLVSMVLLIVGALIFAIGVGVLLVWFVTNPTVHAGIRAALCGLIVFLLGLLALKLANG